MKYQKIIFCIFFFLPTVVPAQFLFKDITPQTGIFMKASAEADAGPGVVVFDFNNDGWDDIYMPAGLSDDKIYVNQHDGTFKNIAPKNVTTHAGWRTNPRGGIAFDYDNDGYTDLYVCCQNRDILWHNDGDTAFTDATRIAYLNFPLDKNESMSATFGDFNGDGYNDFYVARWVDESKFNNDSNGIAISYAHKGFPSWFYVNNHDGTFTDRGKEFRIDGDTGCKQVALFFDYDRDGDLDLLVGNDFGVQLMPNTVYKNMLMETGIASFVDVTDSIGMRSHLFCMGTGPLDYNRDGNFDFYETSIGPDSLMKNDGHNIFHGACKTDLPHGDGYERSGSGYMTTTWTAQAGDFDNDGWEDEVVAHGYEGSLPPWIANPSRRDTTMFYHNINGKFHDYVDSALVDSTLSASYLDIQARGIGAFDFNHDGKLDLCVASLSLGTFSVLSDLRILQNITPTKEGSGHWLEMRFTAKRTAKEAIGTIADVWTGGKVSSRQVSTGGGFGSQTSLVQHVGLGQYPIADSIIVYWPCDKYRHRQIDKYYNVKGDTILQFIENTGSALNSVAAGIPKDQIALYPNPASKALTVENLQPSLIKHFEIYDLLGIKHMDFSGSESTFSFSIASLKPGCYVLRIITTSGAETKRFIKE